MWYFNVKTTDLLEETKRMSSAVLKSSTERMERAPDTKDHDSGENDENNRNAENSSQEKKQWALSDFSMGKKIAKGSFGIVYSAKEKHQDVVVAMKILFKTEIAKTEMKQQVRKEIEIHTHLNHPNILRMYGWFQDEKRIFMVMELAPGRDLLTIMNNIPIKRFSEPVAASYVSQLTEAMKYIHKKRIIHRDVKLENIVLGKDNVLKLTDFGWAIHTPTCKSFGISKVRGNMAPEMLLNKPYDHAVDIWAIGVVGFHLITGMFPFFARDKEHVVKKITNVEIEFPDQRPCSDDARDLISKLIVFDPAKRLTLGQISKHEWILKNR